MHDCGRAEDERILRVKVQFILQEAQGTSIPCEELILLLMHLLISHEKLKNNLYVNALKYTEIQAEILF